MRLSNINFYIKKTKHLIPSEIKLICSLKDTEWYFGIEEQKNWFQKEINKRDIHILLKNKNDLIGYTCLRYKKLYFKNLSNSFLLFDTHIIKKKFRNKGFGEMLITKAMKIINNKKALSILFCKKSQLNYYKKFNWNVVNKNKYLINKNNKKLYLMFFGKKNLY